MQISRQQFASMVRSAAHISDGTAIAAFLLSEGTEQGTHPFPTMSVGAILHTWAGRSFDFRITQVPSTGTECLLRALTDLPHDLKLVQAIFRAPPYTAHVFHLGDGLRIVGAVLHSRSGIALPVPASADTKPARKKRPPGAHRRDRPIQLDLFAGFHL